MPTFYQPLWIHVGIVIIFLLLYNDKNVHKIETNSSDKKNGEALGEIWDGMHCEQGKGRDVNVSTKLYLDSQ